MRYSTHIVFALMVASAAIGLLSQLVLTRVLGTAEYGRYSVMLAWCLAVAPAATAGLDGTILRFAPHYFEQGRGRQLRRFAAFVGWAQAGAIFIASVLLSLAAPPPALGWQILLMAATASLGTFCAFFSAFRQFPFTLLYQNFVRPGVLVAGLIIMVLVGGERDAIAALAITALASAVALAAMLAHILYKLHARRGAGEARFEVRQWLGFAGWAQLASVGQQSVVHLPVILLGLLSGPEEAGLYALAARLSALATYGTQAATIVAAPAIASAQGRGATGELAPLARTAARSGTLAASAALTAALVAGPRSLEFFGPGFSRAFPALLALLLGTLLASSCGIGQALLMMSGRQRQAVGSLAAGAAVLLVAAAASANRWGSCGVAIAMAAGTAVGARVAAKFVRKALSIDCTIGARSPD